MKIPAAGKQPRFLSAEQPDDVVDRLEAFAVEIIVDAFDHLDRRHRIGKYRGADGNRFRSGKEKFNRILDRRETAL